MNTKTHHILPARLRGPLALAVAWLLPQSLLLALNLRSWWLVGGEMVGDQPLMMGILTGCQIGLLVFGLALVLGHAFRKDKAVHWLWSLPILAVHIAYLVLAFVWVPTELLPQSTSLWILPPQIMLFQQFALIMPAAFYAGCRLACFPRLLWESREIGISLASCILFPAMWYGAWIFMLSVKDLLRGLGDWTGWIFGFILIVATVLSLAAMVRFIVLLFHAVRKRGKHGMVVYCLLIGLVGPLCGLALNKAIPFPYDFQSPWIYLIAAANGLLLMMPVASKPWLHRVQWLGLCLLFCYVVYFFLVFLPYLPLSLLAMIAMFSGLLMLVPTVLFTLQGLRIWDGYRTEVARIGRGPATALLLIGLTALPALLFGVSKMHRSSLHKAIEYVYERDPADATPFTGNRAMLKTSLTQMYRIQNGFQLPFINAAYKHLVFDGLTLPDKTLQEIHRTFFGEVLVAQDQLNIWNDFGLGPASERGWGGDGWGLDVFLRPTPSDVPLKDVTWTRVDEDGGTTRAIAKVVVGHEQFGEREFAQTFDLPEGVFVSGFWLHIGNERVPGRIFEKKAALWVYRMIRDSSPRDPGLLYYTDPEGLDLRVYPVLEGQDRTVEIEFLFPTGLNPELTIQDHAMPSGKRAAETLIANTQTENALVVLGKDAPRMKRKPYLHAIVDRSKEAGPLSEKLEEVQTFAEQKGFDALMVTLANYEFVNPFTELVPPAALESMPASPLPKRGGFLRDGAIEHVFLQHQWNSTERAETFATRVPHVVVFRDAEPIAADLAWFEGICPDAKVLASVQGAHAEGEGTSDGSVCVLRRGEGGRVVVADGDTVWVPGPDSEPLQWWRDGAFEDVPTQTIQTIKSRDYEVGVEVWTRHLNRARHRKASGEDLSDMVAASRETGILLPDSSYIVVENSAQWNMLKVKERQKLGAKEAFEFDQMDAPEPGMLWLLVPFGIWAAWRRRSSVLKSDGI